MLPKALVALSPQSRFLQNIEFELLNLIQKVKKEIVVSSCLSTLIILENNVLKLTE